MYDKAADIPDNRRYVPHGAKLYGPFGWSPRGNDNPEDYLQLDLGAVRAITAVATQGSGLLSYEWIKTFKLRFQHDASSTQWTEYNVTLKNCYLCKYEDAWGKSKQYWCTYNDQWMTANIAVRHDLKTIQEARFIRFVPVDYRECKTMRVNVFFVNQEAPRIDVITPSERSIFVRWTIQPCGKLTQLITGYVVDVSTKGIFNVSSTITSKNITGLQPNTEYKIRVKAVPYGLWSDNKTIQTDIAVPQGIQSVVTLKTLSPNSISVTWKHPQKHSINGPLTGYRITYTTNKGQSKNVDIGVVNTWNITSLEKCTWYSVTVSVNNSKYIGPPSKNATIRIGNAPMAGPTKISTIPASSSAIAVSWGPVTMDNLTCDITGYDVKLTQRKCADIKSDDWIIESTNIRSTIFTGLSPSTMYSVSVRAITIAGPGPYSKPICVSTTQRNIQIVKTVKKKWYRTQFIVRKYPEGNVTSDRPPRTDLPDYKKCKESPFCFSYIAAEIEGYNVTIGDGRMYNGYYNAPLEPATTYRIFTRSVSKSSDKTIEYFPAIGSYAFKTTTTKSNTKNNTDVFTAKKQEVESASWLTLPSFVAILTINIILIIAIIVITTFALRRKMFCKKKQADSTKNETAYASVEMKDRNVRNNGRKTTRYQMSPPTEQSSNDHYQSLDKTTRTTQNTVKYKNVRRELPAIPKI